MKCSACGSALVADARFCSYCGLPVAEVQSEPEAKAIETLLMPERAAPEQAPATPQELCINCGAQLYPDESFCTSCGARGEPLVAPAASPPALKAKAAPPPEPPTAPKTRFCMNCGARMGDEEAFCTSCGTMAEAPIATANNNPAPLSPPAGMAGGSPAASAAPPVAAVRFTSPMVEAKRPGKVEYKGVGPRFLASLVDLILYLVFTVALASQFGSTSAQASDGVGFSFNLQGWPAAFAYLVSMAYMVLMEGYLGGTVGKLALGIRVVDLSGNKPGPVRALIRNVLRIVDFLPIFYLLGILLVAFSKDKRRVGDRVAGTYVISSRSVNEMVARGGVAKPANTAVAAVAGVLALVMILSGAIFSPQAPGVPSAGSSGQAVKPQPTATPAPTKSSSSGGGPFGISLPSVSLPFIGGDPVDVAGKWSGSMTITGAKMDGATGDEQKKLDQEFGSIKGTAIPMQFTFDGKNKDSGTVSLGGSGSFGGSQKFEYKVSGDKVTFGGKADDGNFTFEGKATKKGSGYEIGGSFKAEGPATGINKNKTMKIEGNWKATK